MKELLNQYNAAEKKIHEAFGYSAEWKIYPICDDTEYWWFILKRQVFFAKTKELAIKARSFEDGEITESFEYYANEIIREGVWRNETHTMVRVDTHTDGNWVMQVFDNTKEVKHG